MKYFVVVAGPELIPTQQNAVTNSFRGTAYGFWHWLPYLWLVESPFEADNAPNLRDRLRAFFGGANFMVFEVSPVNWAGQGPLEWADWPNRFWPRPGPAPKV
jgi:hypothetical protein